LPSAALMPPSAAPEWLRTGWILERSATSAPASKASIAARMPAQPAPTISTSCLASTCSDAIGWRLGAASLRVLLEAWAGCDDLGPGLVRELLEVVAEHPRKLARLAVVSVRVTPRRARIEQPRVDGRHCRRHVEPEQLVLLELDPLELAGERRLKHGAGLGDRNPRALAERAAGPARVDEPDRRAMAVEPLAEHVRIDSGRLQQKGSAEAGRESRLRLGDADLGARELGRKAGEEIEHRLLARKACERRKEPE